MAVNSRQWPLMGETLAQIRESFCESGEGVRLPREKAELRGSPGNFRGSPENFRGSPETSGEPLACCKVPQ